MKLSATLVKATGFFACLHTGATSILPNDAGLESTTSLAPSLDKRAAVPPNELIAEANEATTKILKRTAGTGPMLDSFPEDTAGVMYNLPRQWKSYLNFAGDVAPGDWQKLGSTLGVIESAIREQSFEASKPSPDPVAMLRIAEEAATAIRTDEWSMAREYPYGIMYAQSMEYLIAARLAFLEEYTHWLAVLKEQGVSGYPDEEDVAQDFVDTGALYNSWRYRVRDSLAKRAIVTGELSISLKTRTDSRICGHRYYWYEVYDDGSRFHTTGSCRYLRCTQDGCNTSGLADEAREEQLERGRALALQRFSNILGVDEGDRYEWTRCMYINVPHYTCLYNTWNYRGCEAFEGIRPEGMPLSYQWTPC